VVKKAPLEVGEAVKVVDGPFQDFEGTVAEVRRQEGKRGVMRSLFRGRAYPLELDLGQVERS